ncbi:MAG: lipid-A-disaccharide synthase [Prevotellaceae bacterium]|jgi:lipid-A-disaccharide synthase|nr:lipid-A-disaccharide synthase [Prevotellaceae bacterium]
MKIYFITGEPSGDLLASSLMKALKEKTPDVEFFGVGGETMRSYGFDSLFDMSELTVMGFFEVVPRLPLILKRIKQTVADIEKVAPDIIITVDSWGFVSTLLSRLKKKGITIPKLHYVAPQVWAWKKGRAKNVAKLTDRLMTLLPHEPKYFEKYGLKCDFTGHPVVENRIDEIDVGNFRERYNIPSNACILSVLPGSRNSEMKRLIPVFKDVIDILSTKINNLFIVIPTVETVVDEVRKAFGNSNIPYRIITGRDERYAAFKQSVAAIAASGTVSLELASCKTPHIVAYKFNPLTNFLADIFVKVKYANLINLLCDKEIIPEFMLDECRADLIADKVFELTNSEIAKTMIAEATTGLQKLRLPDMLPSQKAAEIVIEMVYTVSVRISS